MRGRGTGDPTFSLGQAPTGVEPGADSLGGSLPRALVEVGENPLTRFFVGQLAKTLPVRPQRQFLQIVTRLEPVLECRPAFVALGHGAPSVVDSLIVVEIRAATARRRPVIRPTHPRPATARC